MRFLKVLFLLQGFNVLVLFKLDQGTMAFTADFIPHVFGSDERKERRERLRLEMVRCACHILPPFYMFPECFLHQLF